MRAAIVFATVGTAAAASGNKKMLKTRKFKDQDQMERALSGSGDAISFDDDFWNYDTGDDYSTMWDDYSINPLKCMVINKQNVVAFDLYGKGNNQCAKKKEGTYLMDVGAFAKAYTAQKQVDYQLVGNNYGNPEALDYVDCTAVEYNDAYYYVKLTCTTQGGLKLQTYSDEYCSNEVGQNVGLYNDVKINFGTCQACVSWPAEVNDDQAQQVDLDDNFGYYHMYDSKLCGAAAQYKQDCGWGCRKQVKKSMNGHSAGQSAVKHGWAGWEKFFLFVFCFTAAGLVWVVLKQRRMMSREDAIVEEAAMNGVGLKKRHVFPIALGIIILLLFAMFMVWKKMTRFLLFFINVGLFLHFVYLRRKAKKAGNGGDGYIKDAGLEIS